MTERSTRLLDRRICWIILTAFLSLSLFPADVSASLVESRMADGSGLSSRTEMMETIRQTLEKDLVAQRLADFGLTTEEVAAKLPTMSDEQLHQLAGLSKDLAGGDGLEVVIAILVVVLLVVLILKLMNKQILIK